MAQKGTMDYGNKNDSCHRSNHRQENRRLVGHFYDMKNRFWAVGCGLGWAVE
jgi:hypothetical protein